MKYNGFIIQKDYASDIFRKDSNGEFATRGGYRCRIYSEDDECLQNILVVVEFAYGFELSYDETADVVDLIMEYIQSLARLMQNRIQDDNQKKQHGVDRKEQQKINEKKQAHGLRISMW